MYRMIIADDEPLIRRGLVENMDWNTLGFEIVGSYEDGKEIIDHLQESPVDVVFTDVSMCEISGLEVAKWISENQLHTKIILISGYRDFSYAKEAIAYGVGDYILKPLDPMEIRRVFSNLRNQLDKENLRLLSLPFLLDESAECRPVLEKAGLLQNSVLNGTFEQVHISFAAWKNAVRHAPAEHIPFLISRLFEDLYKRMSESEMQQPATLLAETSKQRLKAAGSLSEQLQAVEELLLEISAHIRKQRDISSMDFIAQAKEYIEQHLAEDLTVENIAASVFLSGSHFSREFKTITGESVFDYVIKRRMSLAKKLIKENNMKLTAISAAVGYSDPKYFQRSFKKYTGYTVREYQAQIR